MRWDEVITGVEFTSDSDPRGDGWPEYFGVHHAVTSSLRVLLNAFAPGGRTVSANLAIGEGECIQTVPFDRRAYTSASWFDSYAITVEVANESTSYPYPIRDVDFHLLAKAIAAWSTEWDRPINGDTVLMHRELMERWGISYATACAGDWLWERKGELLELARKYKAGSAAIKAPVPEPEEEDMKFLFIDKDKSGKQAWVLLNVSTGKYLVTHDQAVANGWATAWGNARRVVLQEFLNAIDAIQKTA